MSTPDRFSRRFFSRHGEDYLLDLMFRDQHSGIFVELGCIDGMRFSNTLSLEKRGWRGLCIEAHTDYIDILRRNRPRSTVVHCTVGNRNGVTGFEKQLNLRTITSLLREQAMPPVDVLSIDVAGCEVNVLQGLDLAQHRPRVIVIESEGVDREREIDSILLPGGYIKGFHVGTSIFYSREAALLHAVAGTCHDVLLTHTQCPLDQGGDQAQRVAVDLTAARRGVAAAGDAGARGAELMDELRNFDPSSQSFELAFAPENELIELLRSDANLFAVLPQNDHWTDYARALIHESNAEYALAMPLFESVMSRCADDWRPAFHLARCADATRQALAMRRGEELHWDILRRFPDCAPSRHILEDHTRRFAFHGDPQYQGMVTHLLNQLPVSDFIETGTFLGRSTAFVARRWPDLKVHSVEINPDFHLTASRRLAGLTNVSLNHSHSVQFLTDLIQNRRLGELPVFYLDAHWEEDWPLPTELDLIRQGCPQAIIVLDDFRVPGHPQFPFDDYGGTKVCAFERVLPHLSDSAAADHLLPQYSRDSVPDYISWAGHVVFFHNAGTAFAEIAKTALAQRHYFTLDVQREFPAGKDAGAALVAPETDLLAQLAQRDFPHLVSFPRTGSHWLRMVLEMYFDRPLLTRSFFDHSSRDYLLNHTHDMQLNVVRENVLYLYRDPVDTLYSQLCYHNEDLDDPQRLAFWADLYGQHASKWLCTEQFTQRSTLLCYEGLRDDPEADFVAAIEHLGGKVDLDRLRDCVAAVDRGRVKEHTAHDQQVINLKQDYASQREQFRARHAETIWKHFLQGRESLATRFGRSPVVVPAAYAPAQLPREGSADRKIIGLVPGKNESRHIEFCIRALSRVCDSIVYFDDDSTDDTLAIVESIATECRVERIIRKRDGEFHETIRRARPLAVGRELGGTHFVVMDADEAFTANLTHGDLLRHKILELQAGDVLELAWICLWRSVDQYRHDGSIWTDNYKPFVFADDGVSRYDEVFIHLDRMPSGLGGKRYRLPGYEYGVLHFQFVNWRQLLVKQAWYRCLERIHYPDKPAPAINELYAPSKDESQLGLREAPRAWYDAYPFFNAERLRQSDTWREQQVLDWFQELGEAHFADLDIWDVDWGVGVGRDSVAVPRSGVDELVEEGERRFASGDSEGARECFGQALKRAPAHAMAHNNLAVVAWDAGDPGQALLHLAGALESDADNREVVFNAVQMLCATGHPADAVVLCRGYLNDHPDDLPLREILQGLESAPDSTGSQQPVQTTEQPAAAASVTDLNEQGEALAEAGDAAGAKAKFLAAHALDAANGTTCNNLAVLAWVAGNLPEAISYLAQAMDAEPDNSTFVVNAVKILIEASRRTDALAVCASYLSDYPDHEELNQLHQYLETETLEPLVSVIVSTYNSAELLRDCLDDLEQQSIADQLEIIVIDSGSQQDERAVVEDFQSRYANIVYLRTEQRETIYAVWNRGAQAARGQYITNANTDDAHHPQALEKLVAALESHPHADLAYASCQWTNVPNQRIDSGSVFRTVEYPEFHPGLAMLFCFLGPHPLWRRRVFDRIGYFDPTYQAAGDYEFQMRFVAAGLQAVKVPEVLSTFYQNTRGLTLGSDVSTQEALEITTRYRSAVPIARLYPVDASDMDALADAWVAQGDLAAAFRCPWIDHLTSEPAYALLCYRNALAIAPRASLAWCNLLALLGQQNEWEECERMLSLAPSDIATTYIDSVRNRKPPAPSRAQSDRDNELYESSGAAAQQCSRVY